ncbi:hypothetical protein OIE69_03005 [Actinacidiphila glaucinigra]|uniref:hypothetical protein n=1 Tax=Actinacidiphila glaucinigra TaxID=235986 RepID=UPI002DD99112|nr:hypothetical protein [Actinacidiphila glaucinigra]WSD57941.1 hypothetical protein OIE69_03005 [Actinacidiphila glaucinigra]
MQAGLRRSPAAVVGLDPDELQGKRLTARVGAGHRLEDLRLARPEPRCGAAARNPCRGRQ